MQDIIHIASLNLCPADRQAEYTSSIQSLIKILNQTSNLLIVFTGNILFDSKQIDQAALELLSELLALCHTHTLVFAQQTSTIIQTIIQTFAPTNRIHFVSNGIHQINKMIIGIYDLSELKKYGKQRAHLHILTVPDGVSSMSKSQLKFITDRKMTVLFDSAHLKQVSNLIRTPRLLPQSFDDDGLNGFAHYHYANKQITIVKIPSEYGFVRLSIETNGSIRYMDRSYSIDKLFDQISYRKIHLRIYLNENIDSKLISKELVKKLLTQKSIQSVSVVPAEPTIKSSLKTPSDLHQTHNQLVYLNDYMNSISYNQDLNKRMVLIHSEIAERLGSLPPRPIGNRIKLIEIHFSNILCYGRGNIINFERLGLSEIVAIKGKNYAGKSSLLDIILFALFDRTSRPERENIMNKKAKRLYSSIQFAIGTRHFVITRRGYRYGKTVQTSVSFQEVANNSILTDLSKQNKTQTNKLICKFIGSYETYVSTIFVLHKNSANILEEGPIKQKRDLCRILGLDVFDTFHTESKRQIEQKERKLKRLNRRIGQSKCPNLIILESELSYYQYVKDLGKPDLDVDLMQNLRIQTATEAEVLSKAFPRRTDLLRLKIGMELNEDYERAVIQIPLLESQIEIAHQIKSDISKQHALESEIAAYEMYNLFTHINKIPFELLKGRLPLIEKNMQSKLKIFGDYDIHFVFNDCSTGSQNELDKEIDKESAQLKTPSIKLYMSKNGHLTNQLKAGCGFEKMIADIMFRLTLAELSVVPVPNIFVIDEELSYFDPSYLPLVKILLDMIKKSYDHVLIISHNEHMTEFADSQLLLKRDADKAGYINNTNGTFEDECETETDSESDSSDVIVETRPQKTIII